MLSKMYDLSLDVPITINEAVSTFDISRSSLYLTMKKLGIGRSKISRRWKNKKIKRLDAWKFAKATWFGEYYLRVLELAQLGKLDAEETEYTSTILAMHSVDDIRTIKDCWPRLSTVYRGLFFDLTYDELKAAAFTKLIPCIEIDDEFYVAPDYVKALQIQQESGVALTQSQEEMI